MVSQSPVAALWRLRHYLRPHRRQLVGMIAAAVAVEAAEITIPLLAKAVIDDAIAHHERGLLLPIGLLAVGLGAASAALSLIRRWVQGNAVADMEKTIRDDLYAHLQRLDPAFHDEWQSGQLLSRATTDLGVDQALRRLRRGVPVHFCDDVHRGDRPADHAQLVARPGHRGHVRPGAGLLLPVRAALQGARPPGAGPGRRPDHAGRGGGHRRPGAQGARPRPRGGRGPPGPGGPARRDPGRHGPAARRLLVHARPGAERGHRPGRRPRRDRGQPPRDDHRRARRLHHPGAAAGLAGRGARLRPRLRRGGRHRRPAGAGDLRSPPGHHRRPGAGRRRAPSPR